ncbi:DUF3524 domain-containing protein [bacterium SCSIO 12741]|nr:DUF3524 domain-containing protein [bacterium SCSIO 12741]
MWQANEEIVLIEPFFGGSHQRWAEELTHHLTLPVRILSLPARHWKWRMHGAAITLAQRFLENNPKPKLILATDMLDLTTFLSLTRERSHSLPVVLYFHENQITYPWSDQDGDVKKQRNHHYGFINYTSCLTADEIWFNSHYHRQSFLEGLRSFISMFPDHTHPHHVEKVGAKSRVIPIGMNIPKPTKNQHNTINEAPLILWNHRWEYDKNPEDFFRLMVDLDKLGLNFRLAVLGEQTGKYPPIFDQAKTKLKHRIDHWGYVESKEDYQKWLQRADLLPVTSRQDFFGISAVEAMASNTYPILPDRLAFPEHLNEEAKGRHLYQNYDDLRSRMVHLLSENRPSFSWKKDTQIATYAWENVAETIESRIRELTP